MGKHIGISFAVKQKLALVILGVIIRRFRKAEEACSAEEIVNITQLPIKTVKDLLSEMTASGILVESQGKKIQYTPAVALDTLTVPFLLEKLQTYGINEVQVSNLEDEHRAGALLKEVRAVMKKKYGKVRVADVQRG